MAWRNLGWLAVVLVTGCGGSDAAAGTGGASGSAGTNGGGAAGSTGTGGSAATGGAAGSGGTGGSAATGGAGGAGGADGGGSGTGAAGGGGGVPPDGTWPTPNDWSWNGSWTPAAGDFPVGGLLDDEYFDAHADAGGDPTPILPPGAWDWDDSNDDLANWNNFESNIGAFSKLLDPQSRHHGWLLDGVTPAAVDYSGPADYFEGSSGDDWLDLGPGGSIHSFASGQLGEGPDVLVFDASYSLDFRTGTTASGAARDDDLVIAGCAADPDGSFDVETTTIHTGPGADWVFVRDVSRAAIDLGNGDGGRTDSVDPGDGADLVAIRGNAHDFRVFGGRGDDVAVWYVDEHVQTQTWLGPNFFGAAGLADAAWDDDGTDRLVLAVPVGTPIVSATPTPAGSLLVRAADGGYVDDPPTAGDPFAYYCVECGTSTGGRKTLILEYENAAGTIHTGYFYVTAFEELQIGIGAGAVVYTLDDVAGTATPAPARAPFAPPEPAASFCQ